MPRLSLLLIFHLVCATLLAVPAHPGRKTVKLPDGTTREVLLRGDEYCHWMETPEGRVIGSRTTSNTLLESRQKMLTHSPLHHQRVGRVGAPGKAAAQSGELLLEGSFPTKGKHRLLALLINYANTTPAYSREQFDAMLNAPGYGGVGSFRDYFLDQSYGQLDITTTVTPWITVSQPRQYYNIDNTPSLIAEALRQIDADIDLRDYDNDHDGILDGLIVIHAGRGQESSGDATDIWSHSSTIYGMQFDGISVYRYTIEPELLNGGPSTIGVFCHEFGHNLGALDYYDTNYSSDGAYGGTGPWDLMGEGAWNGPNGNGACPAPFTAWQKWQFGWTSPTILDESQHIDALSAGSIAGDAYRMDTTTEGDYFMLENIQPVTPWTAHLPGHGLLVTHIVESIFRQRMSMNNINHTYPQGIYTVCADAHADPAAGQPSSYGDLTSAATPFPGTRGHTAFSDETLPSTHSHDGRFGYIALQHIAESDPSPSGMVPPAGAAPTISFDFILGEAPQRPDHLTASVLWGTVDLSWSFPADKTQPSLCNVYRDGHHIATVASPTAGVWRCADADCQSSGLVTYSVDATYPDGLTSAVSTVATRIPQQVATNLVATTQTADDGTPYIDLNWTLPSTLTRCVDDLRYELVDHYATTFAYAHRFRADDLLPHIGRQVKSISFIPQQRSTDASYRVCVWRMPAVEGEAAAMTIPAHALELVAERNVSEFSPSYQRSVPFVSRPTIEQGYDYLIGVEITSKTNLAEAVCDQSELQRGYGNLMAINGGSWQTDPSAKGNYILSAVLTGEATADTDNTLIFSDFSTSDATLFNFFWCPFDVDADLFFPLGFTVYGDGLRVAETRQHSLRLPIDYQLLSQHPDGTTTLAVTSTYKSGNQSRLLEVTLPCALPDGINLAPATVSAPSALYDLSGRRVTIPSGLGLFISGGRKVIR